ncbi:stage III sporulation protein AD [Alkalicella caledoniensis]|uniref:Stage III sporulation protein AD n=1 Tax=Alkalicella caledoniensis TaxID=2731377 RepID=A0A7G9WBT5_ALKCA|nr:stage III sporulation protein AD [Alkalicella caledoniensis]QNO16147.1 stage III sporulation protein AD [Alkalicella caledoniensis]
MDIIQIVAFGLISTVIIILIKQQKPEIAMQITLAAGAMIFLALAGSIYTVMKTFEELAYKADLNMIFLGTMLRIIGIAYVTEFGAQVCRDAGEGTIANKVEFAGKIMMILLAVPIISTILNTLIYILP